VSLLLQTAPQPTEHIKTYKKTVYYKENIPNSRKTNPPTS